MPANETESRLHIWLTGRVQGVGFRAFVTQQAQDFAITGWVRNVGYDQVEVVAEGERNELERFLQRVQIGPRVSLVNDVRIDWSPSQGEFRRFKLRWI